MATIRCPHCGTANREGSYFCNRCGVDLRAEADFADDAETGRPAENVPSAPAHDPATADVDNKELGRYDSELNAAAADDSALQMVFAQEETLPFDEEEDSPVTDLPNVYSSAIGMLAPVRITVHSDQVAPDAIVDHADSESQGDLWRRVRTRMSAPPLLAAVNRRSKDLSPPALQARWLFLVLALAVILPTFLFSAWPSSSASRWSGVDEAFETVDGLAPNSRVLVFWAYDPSTAGELDLAALPVATHLFQKRARLSVISQLPGGPASARRLVDRARLAWQRNEEFTISATGATSVPISYLPGGASTLALVGQDLDTAFLGPLLGQDLGSSTGLDETPDLVIVLAAQAEDVQNWLEQVRPSNLSPVVAVVAAGADPAVRPYFNSGQLVGLVSGFDGAQNYQKRLDEQARRASTSRLDRHLILQDWGHLVFFLAIVLGNFGALIRRTEKG